MFRLFCYDIHICVDAYILLNNICLPKKCKLFIHANSRVFAFQIKKTTKACCLKKCLYTAIFMVLLNSSIEAK